MVNIISNKLSSLIPWDELEDEAKVQINNALQKPFLKKLAIMPDCHTGYDLPIGGVALLDRVISPAYVGYDIGCGVSFMNTGIETEQTTPEKLQKIFNLIKENIPTGEGRENKEPIPYQKFTSASGNSALSQKVNDKIGKQIGTLGGGNHFIEIGSSKRNEWLCITIHSGSRNPGHSVGGYYMALPSEFDNSTGFFSIDSDIGKAYIEDMNFMLQYALDNRKAMMLKIIDILKTEFYISKIFNNFDAMINKNHNHAIVNEDGTVLHRKGAISANEGEWGVIPCNMRDGAFLVYGTGLDRYLCSASHGAGRRMSRSKARKTVDYDVFKKQMEGIVSSVSENIIDEAPDAYKDATQVIERQNGVNIFVEDRILPLINVKGEGLIRGKKSRETLDDEK